MKLLAYIKRTAVRRVVWIVVGLLVYAVLELFNVAWAQSQTPDYSQCFNFSTGSGTTHWCETEARARQAVEAHAAARGSRGSCGAEVLATYDHPLYGTYVRLRAAYINYSFQSCDNPGTWDGQVYRDYLLESCTAGRTGQYNINTSLWGNPPQVCDNGCKADLRNPLCTSVLTGPNVGYWCNYTTITTGEPCTPGNNLPGPEGPNDPPKECSPGQVRISNGQCRDRGDCPVGQHKAADGSCQPNGSCPTGQVKTPDGGCVPQGCPAGQVKGPDGTCKEDANGDGIPDDAAGGGGEDGKSEFSGGDDCNVPPKCSGDAIMCGQARIQWRIDCNTRKNRTVSGGNGCGPGNAPVCTGEKCDAVETAQLVQQWRAACALAEGAGQGGPGGPGGGGSDNGDLLAFLKGGVPDGDGDAPGVPWLGEGGNGGGGDGKVEWSSGVGSGSCPSPISTSVGIMGMSTNIEFSWQPLCDFAHILRNVLRACALAMSAFIMLGTMRR